jgi:glycosyltransferase involved in cell wall biosynthesis
MYADPRSEHNPGGGEIQLKKTAEYMRRLGTDVEIFDRTHGALYGYDWLHIFGTMREGLDLAWAAKQCGARVALSTVSWYDPWVSWCLEPTLWRRLRGVAVWGLRRVAPAVPSWRRQLLQLCDLLLPNSRAEARQLEQLFGVSPSKTVVVPNGVDERFAQVGPALFEQQYGLREFVLVPGRIEPRKNQLQVLRALWGAGLPVVVLGDPHPNHLAYLDECRRAADPGVTFIGRLHHDSPLLASAYSAARVVVLASWFETPGLAALEGALAGAAIVVTERGSAREYFGDLARYVPPDDGWCIREAVREAYRHPRRTQLREAVHRAFLWHRVAQETLEAYRSIDDGSLFDGTESQSLAVAA